MTAKRACSAPQLEVLLKLKQSNNPEFGFLRGGHELHPYYLLMKANGGMIIQSSIDGEGGGKKCDNGGDAQSDDDSCLKSGSGGLVDYSSSSSENDNDGEGGNEKGGIGGIMGLGMYSSSDDENDDGDGIRGGNKDIKSSRKSKCSPPTATSGSGGLVDYASSFSSDGDDKDKSDDTKKRLSDDGSTDCKANPEKSVSAIEKSPKKVTESTSQELSQNNADKRITLIAGAIQYCQAPSPCNKALEKSKDQKVMPSSSSSTLSVEELRAKRLKRARLMKGHFALKMMDKK
uniref:SURP motif domain-containing protein n=1 Tax=Ditylum brightwellii TaxID=49249 RepID=A0A7S4T297_9STRA|mmetsp:Transcript_59314/g.88072  ORF Transcript_59314/g.88072 Transcript_59314/m.88072 type:complete len:289 (+) Transcript_59314:95-961(+)